MYILKKEKFLREFKIQEDNRKQEIKDLIKMKETFKKQHVVSKKALKAYREDLFDSGPPFEPCFGYGATCVPNYKSFYGKRCSVGKAVHGYEPVDLGGISKENMKKLASAIDVSGITDVKCPRVNGKDWLNKKWLKRKKMLPIP